MGEFANPNRDMNKLMKILIRHEEMEDSTGYHAIDFERFVDDIMFLDTLAYSRNECRFYWSYLKDLRILCEIDGVPYLDVARFFQYCRLHAVHIPESDPVQAVPETLDRKNPIGEGVKSVKKALAEGSIYPDDAVFTLISSAGRRGMSYNRIRRLGHEVGISFEDISDVLLLLFCRGQITRTEDDFYRTVNFEMTVPGETPD